MLTIPQSVDHHGPMVSSERGAGMVDSGKKFARLQHPSTASQEVQTPMRDLGIRVCRVRCHSGRETLLSFLREALSIALLQDIAFGRTILYGSLLCRFFARWADTMTPGETTSFQSSVRQSSSAALKLAILSCGLQAQFNLVWSHVSPQTWFGCYGALSRRVPSQLSRRASFYSTPNGALLKEDFLIAAIYSKCHRQSRRDPLPKKQGVHAP